MKVIHEIDVHLTKVVEVPEGFPEQISYKAIKNGNDGDRIPKRSVYSLGVSLAPIINNYDKVDIKDIQMFITEEEEKHDESGNESESSADVSGGDVAGESVENA